MALLTDPYFPVRLQTERSTTRGQSISDCIQILYHNPWSTTSTIHSKSMSKLDYSSPKLNLDEVFHNLNEN